ncbi:MAG: hypothetical protein WBA70_03035, partial [Thermodesulfobacteriota bacterium]
TMNNRIGFFILILIAFIFSLIGPVDPVDAGEAKKISVNEICESNMDEPMGGDNLYKDKTVQTSIEINMVKKIHSLCNDTPEGTFTVEFTTKGERVVQCFCNAPDQKSILETSKGSTVNIEGTFKSMTASFFETESKQCTITIQNCTFN